MGGVGSEVGGGWDRGVGRVQVWTVEQVKSSGETEENRGTTLGCDSDHNQSIGIDWTHYCYFLHKV